MMTLEIAGKAYTLHFGLGFLREMNRIKSVEMENAKMGYGAMVLVNAGFALGDPLAFVDVIRAATANSPQKPSDEELESWLEELIVTDKYNDVSRDVFEEIKKSQLLKLAMKVEQTPIKTTRKKSEK